ncbi:hypothetical protein [Hasllibacter sp. MH4015]|uniref:hypothetical protein n=1 Tax=Hasllibacter sp. MH4015 TaxID=2854029 RepID=UPI001CD6199C|nr:hypothetical protein [Hasllibacter sp. MH4015]
MTRSLTLPDFGEAPTDPGFGPAPAAMSQAQEGGQDVDQLDAYDNGYKSGWADCAAAEAEERKSVSADLGRNLKDAELTFDAARRDVLAALGPLFEDIASTVLPELAAAAIAPTVLAELTALAENQAEARIEIVAAPGDCASLQRLVEDQGFEVRVRPEPAFAEGQVTLQAGATRRDLDVTGAARRIAEAIVTLNRTEPPPSDQWTDKGAA